MSFCIKKVKPPTKKNTETETEGTTVQSSASKSVAQLKKSFSVACTSIANVDYK